MPSETRRKPIHGGSDTASLRCRVSEGTALTPFTLRKTKHYGRGEHAVKPSWRLRSCFHAAESSRLNTRPPLASIEFVRGERNSSLTHPSLALIYLIYCLGFL